jgi:thymidylate kinase
MIINPRGTSGSGKTTVVRGIMDHYPIVNPIFNENQRKPIGYQLLGHPDIKDTYVVGSYENVCGGCDSIKTQDEICDRVRRFAPLGHVLVEGLLMSHLFSRYVGLAKELIPIPYVWAFLDTPLSVCIERVQVRRNARGITTPLNTKNTEQKWHDMRRVFAKCQAAKLDARWLDHTNPVEIVWGWLLHAER